MRKRSRMWIANGTFAHKNTFTWKPSAFKACRISCTLEIRKCSASFVIQDTWTWQFVSEGGWTARAKTAEFERVCKQTLKTVTIRHVVIFLKLSSYIGSSTNCIKLHHRLARIFFKSFKDFLRCLVILYIRELQSFYIYIYVLFCSENSFILRIIRNFNFLLWYYCINVLLPRRKRNRKSWLISGNLLQECLPWRWRGWWKHAAGSLHVKRTNLVK